MTLNSNTNIHRYVVLDLETTGFDPLNDEITQIGLLKIENDKIIEEFSQFVRPKHTYVSEEVSKLTGITNELLLNYENVEQYLPKVLEIIGEDKIVGYNIREFDILFFNQVLSKNGHEIINPNSRRVIDVYGICKKERPFAKKRTLKAMCREFGVKSKNNHNAIEDCRMTFQLFNKIRGI